MALTPDRLSFSSVFESVPSVKSPIWSSKISGSTPSSSFRTTSSICWSIFSPVKSHIFLIREPICFGAGLSSSIPFIEFSSSCITALAFLGSKPSNGFPLSESMFPLSWLSASSEFPVMEKAESNFFILCFLPSGQ